MGGSFFSTYFKTAYSRLHIFDSQLVRNNAKLFSEKLHPFFAS